MDLCSLFHLNHSVVIPICFYIARKCSWFLGAYRSIVSWRRPFIFLTITVRHRLHSTFIAPSEFLYPVTIVPQFAQCHEKGTQISCPVIIVQFLYIKFVLISFLWCHMWIRYVVFCNPCIFRSSTTESACGKFILTQSELQKNSVFLDVFIFEAKDTATS